MLPVKVFGKNSDVRLDDKMRGDDTGEGNTCFPP